MMPLLTALKPETLTPDTLCVFTGDNRYPQSGSLGVRSNLYLATPRERYHGYTLRCFYILEVCVETGFIVGECSHMPEEHVRYALQDTALGARVVGEVDLTDPYAMRQFLKQCLPLLLEHMRSLPFWDPFGEIQREVL